MSIYKVAARAGVSKSTVSRVINGGLGVSESTAQAVHTAMRELGYQPGPNRPGPKPRARNGVLRAGGVHLRHGAIALIDAGPSPHMLRHPYFMRVHQAVAGAAAAHNLRLVTDSIGAGDVPACIRADAVDGALVTGRSPCAEVVRLLDGAPSVWISGGGRAPLVADHILADNFAIGVMAVDYLLSKGCRRLMFLDCDPAPNVSQTRAEAFAEHARDAGVAARTMMLPLRSPDDPARSEADLRARIERILPEVLRPPVPDGLFIPYQRNAGLLREMLRERGVVAGGPGPDTDIVLIAAANDPPGPGTPRSIAVIDPNHGAKAAWAIRRLLERIEHPSLEPVRMLVVPKLIEPTAE